MAAHYRNDRLPPCVADGGGTVRTRLSSDYNAGLGVTSPRTYVTSPRTHVIYPRTHSESKTRYGSPTQLVNVPPSSERMEVRYNPVPVMYSERPNMYSERPNMYSERPNVDSEDPNMYHHVPQRVISTARRSRSPSLIAPRQSGSPMTPPPVVQSPVPAFADEGSQIRPHDAYVPPARVITLGRSPVHPTPILIRI